MQSTTTALADVDAHADLVAPGNAYGSRSHRLLNRIHYRPHGNSYSAFPTNDYSLNKHISEWRPSEVWFHRLPELISRLAQAGLTGRGGAHFPAAEKWRTVSSSGQRPILVANGAEGEPWSAKDVTLLLNRPHLILDGLAAASQAFGTDEVIIWCKQGSPAISSIQKSCAERAAAGYADPVFRIFECQDHYLSGESSALINALTNGTALPSFQQSPAALAGINGRPTLVHNVESWANVGILTRSAFAPTRSQLITLVTPAGRFVFESTPDQTLGDLAEQVRQIPGSQLRDQDCEAVLIGGFGGSWVPWLEARDLVIDESSLKARNLSVGAGVVALLPNSGCGLRQTSPILSYLAASSARQCGPCMFGLDEVASTFASLASGRVSRRSLNRLYETLGLVEGRGACHHPDGAVRLARSALFTFSADVERHARRGRCVHHGSQSELLPVPPARSR